MFDNISKNFTKIFNNLSGKKFITLQNIEEVLREVRINLLQSDVALEVVKKFIDKIRQDTIGKEVIKSVKPSQMIIKIINDHLIELLGEEENSIILKEHNPTVIMMVGLQSSGKTTSSAKLAKYILENYKKKKILLASLDTRRPAAQKQLELLSQKAKVESLEIIPNQDPITITKRAINEAKGYDFLILDTAGRMHVNKELMKELKEIKRISNPHETILTIDALMGQDAINLAKEFKEEINVDGLVITRVDGDSKAGCIMTAKSVTNAPIKFLGVGEDISDLELFEPKRIASRILGMGDVVSLVEKAQDVLDQKEAENMEKKIKEGNFDINDLKKQINSMKKMGGIGKIVKFLPSGLLSSVDSARNKLENFDRDIDKQLAIINSMNKKERINPDTLNSSRKRRVAKGSGTNMKDVNSLLKKFKNMKKAMKKIGKMTKEEILNMVKNNNLS